MDAPSAESANPGQHLQICSDPQIICLSCSLPLQLPSSLPAASASCWPDYNYIMLFLLAWLAMFATATSITTVDLPANFFCPGPQSMLLEAMKGSHSLEPSMLVDTLHWHDLSSVSWFANEALVRVDDGSDWLWLPATSACGCFQVLSTCEPSSYHIS